MKKTTKFFGAIFFACAFLTSCGENTENADNSYDGIENYSNDLETVNTESNEDDNESELNSSNETSSSSDNCDEFLKGYEKFMDEYITIVKKMKKNPTDMNVMTSYTSMMTEANEWADKTADCSADPKFSSKFVAIQTKISNAVSGL